MSHPFIEGLSFHGERGKSVFERRSRPRLPESGSIFARSLVQTRHPLDVPFQCGFDPVRKSLKAYREHISQCRDQDCRERLVRWLDLVEYFQGSKSMAAGA